MPVIDTGPPASTLVAGGCHCGAVRFEARGDFSSGLSCNCSICQKHGYLLAFIPASEFRLLSGEEVLGDYLFYRHVIHHLFCRNCGIGSFTRAEAPDGRHMVAVNIRCLDDVDLARVAVTPFDGRSR